MLRQIFLYFCQIKTKKLWSWHSIFRNFLPKSKDHYFGPKPIFRSRLKHTKISMEWIDHGINSKCSQFLKTCFMSIVQVVTYNTECLFCFFISSYRSPYFRNNLYCAYSYFFQKQKGSKLTLPIFVFDKIVSKKYWTHLNLDIIKYMTEKMLEIIFNWWRNCQYDYSLVIINIIV